MTTDGPGPEGEYEQRGGRAPFGRSRLGADESAIVALVLAALSLLGTFMFSGLLWMLTLPASWWAWSLGRRARHTGVGPVQIVGTVGEALGIATAGIACLGIVACAFLAMP